MCCAVLILASACSREPEWRRAHTLTGELPADMSLPLVRGDANEVADQVCAWARAHQRPFPRDLVESVNLRHVGDAFGGEGLSQGLVKVFIQSRDNPQRMIVHIDPQRWGSRGGAQRGSEELFAQLNSPGRWMFEKLSDSECQRAGSRAVWTRFNPAEPLCVRARILEGDEAGAIETTSDAEFNWVFFDVDVDVGPFRARQGVHIEILTLWSGAEMAGRSVRAELYADPRDFGRTGRVCQPAPNPIVFESAEGITQ